ncbi:PREDICTED: swi5-dependent recombination DNA repair protein 1 homolog [Camelina sativa]|uniref:Swi5-dependent recombination DNA repair protein 1 homolog n=1 Tax=Camelina sativa TaxID=90675 RepID=A0ABM0ZB98_CAMSA|nr:PREDICTED: swi5-dependent recombination DNA repair protein 1 homolog [Camelina sativa]
MYYSVLDDDSERILLSPAMFSGYAISERIFLIPAIFMGQESTGIRIYTAATFQSNSPKWTNASLKIPVPKPRSLKKQTKPKSSPSSPPTKIATHNPYDVLALPPSSPLLPNPPVSSPLPNPHPNPQPHPPSSSSQTDPISYMVIDSPSLNIQANSTGENPPPSGGPPLSQ